MSAGNMFLTNYHRQLEEAAKKSKGAETKKVSAPEKDNPPKTVKRPGKK